MGERSRDRIPMEAKFSAPVQTSTEAHQASCTMGTESFPGVKSDQGVTLTPYPLLVQWSRKRTAITLLPLWAVRPVESLSACTVQLYLYSPYGPYSLYRASVPVQYSYTPTPPMGCTACTEPQFLYSRAIPLLPLWAVRPLQTLSACTVQLYLYSPYGPYSLYSTAKPLLPLWAVWLCTESQCLYSTAIPLLPLWAIWPVQSLSACTVQLYLYSPYGLYSLYSASVPVQYSYTSIPLWAVRPAQSLSVCTVELYLYSPYGPYGLYRASVSVQYSYTSTPPMGHTACTEPQCL